MRLDRFHCSAQAPDLRQRSRIVPELPGQFTQFAADGVRSRTETEASTCKNAILAPPGGTRNAAP
jgi:hypothetical protein